MDKPQQLLNQLEGLTRSIVELPAEDRVLFFRKIYPLVLALKGELRGSPNAFAAERLGELEWRLTAIAQLDDGDGEPEAQHFRLAVEIIHDLQGPQGFGTRS